MDLNKLKSFVDNKNVTIDIEGDVVRYNFEIGNDDSWREINIYNRGEEQIAVFINTQVSKFKTGKVSVL